MTMNPRSALCQIDGRAPGQRTSTWQLLFILLLLSPVVTQDASGQSRFSYKDTPVRQVISDIQAATDYHFLYRDALITGKSVTFEATAQDVIATLEEVLQAVRIEVLVDETRQQILLSKATESLAKPTTTVSGHVIDDESGARLPYATVTWKQNDHLRGTATNEAGAFHLQLAGAEQMVLTASYVGYQAQQVHLSLQELPQDLAIRLTPSQQFGPEVVVNSTMLHTDLDTTWHHLLRPGVFSSLGESNVLRSLQTLPSVSLSTALSPGLNVRGSKADGFQVLLDGVPIYNQNHFFGLFDAFNEDALQTVGFYYGVTPAHLQAPPGGTVSFVTRTGSQTQTRTQVGLSNTALKGTLEGPLGSGRGSWLLSGRHSYLNLFEWFNNPELIAQGLDVVRATSANLGGRGANGRTLFPGASSARFYDVHGKLYLESARGARFMLTTYLGGDNTSHAAERFLDIQNPPTRDSLFIPELTAVKTQNAWANEAASLHYQQPLQSSLYSHTLLAFSRYQSDFAKDDFLYTKRRPQKNPEPALSDTLQGPFYDLFAHENDLFEWKLSQQIGGASQAGSTWSAGYALHHYEISYAEQSALRNDYADINRSVQLDAFAQLDIKQVNGLDLHLGLRSHYFTKGSYFRLSPRMSARLFPERRVSFGVGYSRNYQFLHRLSLANLNSADVWIMSTKDQPPGSVDHLNAGLYVKVLPTLFFQAEAYIKSFKNLRIHETAATRRPLDEFSLLFRPWLHDNNGLGRGLELMLRHQIGSVIWTNSYTLSKMELQHDALNNGDPFLADWDRRHQFTSHLQADFTPNLTGHFTWVFATGAPNNLAYTDPTEPTTLDDYHRLDVSLQYREQLKGVMLEAKVGAFNVYDRQNAWYRTPTAILDRSPAPPGARPIRYTNVDVYDLGFQPSFSFGLTF